MLDCIGDIAARAVNVCLLKAIVKEAACGSNEGSAGEILLVARLLSDKNDVGVSGAFTKNKMCRSPVEVATGTVFGGTPDRAQVLPRLST
jgi:hypothetical protein